MVSTEPLSTGISAKLQQMYKEKQESEQEGEDEVNEARSRRDRDRPLLILLDRNHDLHTMLYHSWTYMNLIQDVYGIKNNQFLHFDETAK